MAGNRSNITEQDAKLVLMHLGCETADPSLVVEVLVELQDLSLKLLLMFRVWGAYSGPARQEQTTLVVLYIVSNADTRWRHRIQLPLSCTSCACLACDLFALVRAALVWTCRDLRFLRECLHCKHGRNHRRACFLSNRLHLHLPLVISAHLDLHVQC